MADISKITLPNGSTYDLKDQAAARLDRGVEYIYGTWLAESGIWTGVSQDSELYEGKKIILFLPFAGSGEVTLNLTLSDGSSTGAKNVYFQAATRMTANYEQYAQIELIYHSALVINSISYQGWWSLPGQKYNEATTTAAGLMSTVDKIKLNNLGGTVIASTTQPSNQSTGDIWLVLKSFN